MEKYFKMASLGAYFISFFLPVFTGDGSPGILAFAVGALAYTLPWLANVFYIIALSIKKKYRVEKLICAAVAVLLATRTFAIHELGGIGSESEPTKVSVGVGFWFWFGSFILLLIGLLAGKFLDKKMPEEKLPA
jgi:hypothetical protein